MSIRWLVVLGAVSLFPGALAAQLPTDPVFTSRRTFREEHLERVFTETRATLQAWNKAIDRRDWKALQRLVTPDLLLVPSDGWMATGPAALDSLRSLLPRLSAFGVTPMDFDASGSMASLYGGVYYQLAAGQTRHAVSADVAIVMVQRGKEWQIRSFIERPRAKVDP